MIPVCLVGNNSSRTTQVEFWIQLHHAALSQVMCHTVLSGVEERVAEELPGWKFQIF